MLLWYEISVKFLGHIFDENKVHGVQDIPIPTSVSAVRSFVGMLITFETSFQASYLPLTELTKKKIFGENVFQMTENVISAFKIAKDQVEHHTC